MMIQAGIRWITQGLRIQLFLIIVSLPILVCWGLPLSLISPLGNILFAPILTLFLLLSSLVFFTELLHIPNSGIIWCLEHLNLLWSLMLEWGAHDWLVHLPSSSFLPLIAGPCIALMIMRNKALRCDKKGIIALIAVLICISLSLVDTTYNESCSQVTYLPCAGKTVQIIRHAGKTYLIDQDGLTHCNSSTSWINCTLLPFLSKQYGCPQLAGITINSTGKRAQQALAELNPYLSL